MKRYPKIPQQQPHSLHKKGDRATLRANSPAGNRCCEAHCPPFLVIWPKMFQLLGITLDFLYSPEGPSANTMSTLGFHIENYSYGLGQTLSGYLDPLGSS